MQQFGSNSAIPDNLDPLERQILAKNAFSQPESDEENQFDFDSDYSIDDELAGLEEEEMFDHMAATVVEKDEDWSQVLNQQRPKNNTGGKGVLADYEEAKKITKRRNETKALKQREAWKKAGYGEKQVVTKADTQLAKPPRSKSRKSDGDDSEDEDEDAFFEKFRMLRMQQFSSVASLPQFGQLKNVGKFEFVDEVDQSDPRTFVVVHLYEDYLIACQRMNKILASLAIRYPHVKFLKLKATEADQTLSHSVLPAFLVYKGGKVVGRAAVDAVKTEFHNETFSEEDVEYMLAAKYGVHLPGVDVSEKERSGRSKEEASGKVDPRSAVVAEYA